MRKIKIAAFIGGNTNPFYDPSKADNGGGYYQPHYKGFFSDGGEFEIWDTSCGDFGKRYTIKVTGEDHAGYVFVCDEIDGERRNTFRNRGFIYARLINKKFGYNIPTEREQ